MSPPWSGALRAGDHVQLWVMHALKPLVLALDGVLFGTVLAFGIGVYSARQRAVRDDLERSREEYRTLTDDVLDTSEVATFILDEEFDVIWVNEATEKYFGVERSDVVGRHKPDLVEESIAEPSAFRERVLETYVVDRYGAETIRTVSSACSSTPIRFELRRRTSTTFESGRRLSEFLKS